MVDVIVSTVINRPQTAVAAYAMDPANAPEWYVNIKSSEWKTEPVPRPGAKIAFTAHFLGRKLEYTYEIIELEPGEKLVMRTSEGPFPMETTYTFESQGENSTKMYLRNRGMPSGFSRLIAPLMSLMMRRATQKDLARLKKILER